MRLLLPPASLDVGASGPILCNCGDLIDTMEMPFHCLDCSSSQFFFVHRHNAVQAALIELFESVVSGGHSIFYGVLPREPLVLPTSDRCSEADLATDAQARNEDFEFTGARRNIQHYRNSRIIERNAGDTRADACVINLTGRQYIDVAITNPAAITYRPKPVPNASGVLLPAPPGSSAATIAMRTADKKHRYHPVLGDDVNVFMRFVAFVVEATGRLSSDACAESKNPMLLHDFVTQVGGAIARYNAMAAQAWVHHCLRLLANLAIGGG